jgi:hypothetical protein
VAWASLPYLIYLFYFYVLDHDISFYASYRYSWLITSLIVFVVILVVLAGVSIVRKLNVPAVAATGKLANTSAQYPLKPA